MRPAAVRPAVSLESRAADNLQFIRQTMERAGSFTAVPGWGGVAMGFTALAAAAAAHSAGEFGVWLGIWMAAALVGLIVGALSMVRKARTAGHSLRSQPARKFAMSFFPALLAGLVLTLVLVQESDPRLLSGTWLLLYGLAAVAGGAFSIRLVPLMGAAFMLLGALALLLPVSWPNAFMAAGFGGLQIGFGIAIARKHGG